MPIHLERNERLKNAGLASEYSIEEISVFNTSHIKRTPVHYKSTITAI